MTSAAREYPSLFLKKSKWVRGGPRAPRKSSASCLDTDTTGESLVPVENQTGFRVSRNPGMLLVNS
jgi:hypothetical protein